MGMKKKYYLIDTENVGNRWSDYISKLKKGHVLVVFYTKNHSKLLEECYLKQRYNKKIRWVECAEGNNALDQQLMGVLSYLIAAHPNAEYTVFSNDKDYTDAIKFWKQRGICVNRVGFDTKKKKKKKEAATDLAKEEPAVDKSCGQIGETAVDKPCGQIGEPAVDKPCGQIEGLEKRSISELTGEELMVEIAKAVPVKKMGNWYALLVSLLGQKDGRELYTQLKDNEEKKKELSQYLLSDTEERKVYLIEMLFRYHQLDETKAKSAYKLVKAHSSKNKKAMKEDFDKHFGKKTAQEQQYYRVIKPVVSILKGKD